MRSSICRQFEDGSDGTRTRDLGGTFQVSWTFKNLNSSEFKNHGAYVSSMGGGDDAAHSCIGMPIQ